MHNKEEINAENEKKKPRMIVDYNATKGAVDTFDKMVKSYRPMRLFFFLVDAACLNASVVWFMTHPEWKRKVAQTTFIPVRRCIRHDKAND